MEKIPEDVKKQILAEQRRRNYDAREATIFQKGAEFGYTLASKEIENLRKDINGFIDRDVKHMAARMEANKVIDGLKLGIQRMNENLILMFINSQMI